MAKKLPPDVLAYFQKQGAKGGKLGGAKSWAAMTTAERTARAKKAGEASAAAMTPAERRLRAKKAGEASAAARKAARKAKP